MTVATSIRGNLYLRVEIRFSSPGTVEVVGTADGALVSMNVYYVARKCDTEKVRNCEEHKMTERVQPL